MKLDLKGIRIVKCDFKNEMEPNMKINLQVNVNNQIKLPKERREDSAGTIITKVMVGSPMHPLYLYMEQISSFADSEPVKGKVYDTDSLMSLYKTICVPQAAEQMEETIKKLCAVYHIPEIKLQKSESVPKAAPGYLN